MDTTEIEARLAAATPGPWAWASAPAEGSSETPAEYVANALTGDGPLFVVWVPSTEGAAGGYVLTAVTGDGPHASFDAEFIAHAPEDIRALLDEVKRLGGVSGKAPKVSKNISGHLRKLSGSNTLKIRMSNVTTATGHFTKRQRWTRISDGSCFQKTS